MTTLKLTPLVLAALLVGCQSSGERQPLRPDPLPPVPPIVQVDVDTDLREAAAAFVIKATQADDPIFRANAAEAAEGLPDDDATAALVPLLEDDDPVVRFAAMMTIGREQFGGPDLVDDLGVLAAGPSPNGRVAAMFAMHRLGETAKSQGLADATTSPDPVVRSHAALALGLTGEPSAVDVLEPMLGDDDATVRLTAAEALWRFGRRDARDRLMEASLSGYTDDSVIGTLALGVHPDPSAFAMLQGKLTDDYAEVQLAAARALGQLGSDAGFGLAREAASSQEPRLRGMAAAAFGDIGRYDAQADLAALLDDDDLGVQLAAAAAILKLDGFAPQTLGAGR
ncbi:MAG: HEAT repeat domain-containing protein [Planctomycetota bacterium]